MKKLLLLIQIFSGVIFSQHSVVNSDTLFRSNFQISNQVISKDKDGRLYLAFTSQTGTNSSSKEIFYAVQESDSFIIKQATSNFTEEISNSLFISKDNNLHMIFLSRDSENLMQLYYMNNVPGKFSKRIQLTKTPVSKIAPKAVMDRLGIIHIVYFTNTFTDNQVYYKTFSTNNFSVSNDMVLCQGETNNDNDADIAIDAKDKIHIVVKSGSLNEGKLKYFSNSTGLMKETILKIKDNVTTPKIIFNGKVLNIFYKNIDDQRLYWVTKKRDFNLPEPVTPENHNPIGFRNCSIDETERIYLIYQNLESSDLKSVYLIYISADKFSSPSKLCNINDNSLLSDISSAAYKDGIVSFLFSSNLRKGFSTNSNLIYVKNYVFGNALLRTSSDTITFGEQLIDDIYFGSINITNEGTTILKLYSPVVSDNTFSVEAFDTLSVQPDSTVELLVSFNPTDTIVYKSNLSISTNATNNKTLKLSLSGKGSGYPEIMTGRDTVLVYNLKEFSDSLLVMNTGTKLLAIDSVASSNPDIKIDSEQTFLAPGDSVYIQISKNSRKKLTLVASADTINIYSNDPIERVKVILIRSINIAAADDASDEQNASYELYQNYPNPFNPSTTISFSISQASYISLAVYDALAREIAELADGFFSAGQHNVSFTAEDISTGIYYYKLRVKSGEKKVPDYVEVKKMILIK